MKVQGVFALSAALCSFGTAATLLIFGAQRLGLSLALAALGGSVALAQFIAALREGKGDAGRRGLIDDTDADLPSVPGTANLPGARVKALMADLHKTFSESADDIRKIVEYPLIGEILSASTAEEVANLVSLAHGRLLASENALSSVRDRALLDCLIYIPLVHAVAAAVPGKTEEAAFAVMERFMVVREAARHAAESARSMRLELEDTSGERSVSATAEKTRQSIGDERTSIRELSRCVKENREHLEAMRKEIESGLELLKGIADITERSKLIAFNMSIEAARIGEKGLGFKVIITELHKLNERTNDFSRQVANLLGRFGEYNEILMENIEDKAGTVIAKVERGIDAASLAVDSLIGATDRSQALTKEIALMSESIDRDLDGVLESLQFQDITRQMIEGSLAILAELRRNVEACVEDCGVSIDSMIKVERFSMLRNRLVRDAKTKGEKSALMEVRI